MLKHILLANLQAICEKFICTSKPRVPEQLYAMEKSTVVGHRKGSGIDDNPIVFGWACWCDGCYNAVQYINYTTGKIIIL